MLLLDTNWLSTMTSPEPVRTVADWILDQPSGELFTAAVCQAEILSGIAILPSGRRSTPRRLPHMRRFSQRDGDSDDLPGPST